MALVSPAALSPYGSNALKYDDRVNDDLINAAWLVRDGTAGYGQFDRLYALVRWLSENMGVMQAHTIAAIGTTTGNVTIELDTATVYTLAPSGNINLTLSNTDAGGGTLPDGLLRRLVIRSSSTHVVNVLRSGGVAIFSPITSGAAYSTTVEVFRSGGVWRGGLYDSNYATADTGY